MFDCYEELCKRRKSAGAWLFFLIEVGRSEVGKSAQKAIAFLWMILTDFD